MALYLLCCTALYFVAQVFANPWSSLGLPLPLWIQKQSNYWHSTYSPPCLQEYVAATEAKRRFGAALIEKHTTDTVCRHNTPTSCQMMCYELHTMTLMCCWQSRVHQPAVSCVSVNEVKSWITPVTSTNVQLTGCRKDSSSPCLSDICQWPMFTSSPFSIFRGKVVMSPAAYTPSHAFKYCHQTEKCHTGKSALASFLH